MIVRNHIIFTGNLGGVPEITHKSEKSGVIARFSVANSELTFDETKKQYQPSHVNWIPVTVFGSLAKRTVQHLKKGDLVTVFGSIRDTSYKDDSGKQNKRFEVIATDVIPCSVMPKATDDLVSESFDNFSREGSIGV